MAILTVFIAFFGFLNPTIDIGISDGFEHLGFKNDHNYGVTVTNVDIIYVDLSLKDCPHSLVNHSSALPQVQIPAHDTIICNADPRVFKSCINVCGANNVKVMFKVDTYITRAPLFRCTEYVTYIYSDKSKKWVVKPATTEEWEQYFVIKDWETVPLDEAYEELGETDNLPGLDSGPSV